MAEAALNLADWILLADVGEHMRQKNDGHRGLARGDVQAALEAGCGLMLRWVGDDGREVCREFPKRDSWEDILVWAGLPQRLCVQLPPDERKGNLPYPYAYLLRADAVRLGLWPALESPQAKQQPQQRPKKREPTSADAQLQPRASKRRRNQGSGPQTRRAAPAPAADASAPVANTEALVVEPVPAASTALLVNLGGRPTDRDMVIEEAGWRLRHQQTQAETLMAFSRELRAWLIDHGRHHSASGEVMKAETIEDHVRPLWNAHKHA